MSENECNATESKCGGKKGGCKFMKMLAWLVAIVLVLGVLGVTVAPVFIAPAIEQGIEFVAPKVLKVPVNIGDLKFSLIGGSLRINDFVLGNPEGYNTESMIQFEEIYVKLSPLSVFTKTIRVKEVRIRAPHITYEVGLGNSNVGTLLGTLNAMKGKKVESDEGETEEEVAEEEEASTRRVTIDLVEVTDGKVKLSAKVLSGSALPIPLPTVTLHDLGKSSVSADVDGEEGITVVDATIEILTKICTSVVDVAKQGLNAAGDVVKDAGNAIKDAGNAVKDAGSKVMNFFKKSED